MSAPSWISYTALGVSGVTLGWNILSWHKSGPKVKAHGDLGKQPNGVPVFIVGAVNDGRHAVTVEACAVLLPNGARH
jgi:hypothetical protein